MFKAARARGLATGFVSNGNATPQVLDYLTPWIDVYKVDLKSFDDKQYRKLGGRLQPILDTIRSLARTRAMGGDRHAAGAGLQRFGERDHEPCGVHRFSVGGHPVACDGVPSGLSHASIRWTRHPRSSSPPPRSALVPGCAMCMRAICQAWSAASRTRGARHAAAILVERYGYHVREYHVTADGRCGACNTAVPGRWDHVFAGQITSHPFVPHDRTRLRVL